MKRSWIAAIAVLIAISASALGATTAGSESSSGTSDDYVAPPAVSCADPIAVASTGPTDDESMSQPRLGLGQDLSKSLSYSATLPAGVYAVEAATHDSYSFRDTVGVQSHEQARVVFVSGGVDIAATGYTTELGDDARTGWALDNLGEITLDQAADGIRVEHYGAVNPAVGPNSLKLTALCVTPVSVDPCANLVEGEAVPAECDPCVVAEGEELPSACVPVDPCANLVDGEEIPAECDPCVVAEGEELPAECDPCVVAEGEELPSACVPVDPCANLVEGEELPAECDPCVVAEGEELPTECLPEPPLAPEIPVATTVTPPTTAAPTTEATTTTVAPTTAVPTTEAPTTEAPTTETTAAPVSVVAVTVPPTTATPVTDASSTVSVQGTVQVANQTPDLQVAQQQLPVTGSHTGVVASVGIMLAVIGAALLGLASRRLNLF